VTVSASTSAGQRHTFLAVYGFRVKEKLQTSQHPIHRVQAEGDSGNK
jgi:hypothetical protein